nr:MAG TPA: hypothetical protein [Caudoviricetes sp.]
MNRYICERRCDEGMRTFKGALWHYPNDQCRRR